MGKFRIVKQYTTGSDALWVSKVTESEETLEYDKESDAYWKMMQISGSDSTGRRYKVVEI